MNYFPFANEVEGFVCGPSEAYLFICWSDCSIYSAFIIKLFSQLFTFEVKSNAPDSNQCSFRARYAVRAGCRINASPSYHSICIWSPVHNREALPEHWPSIDFPAFLWAVNMKHNITFSAIKASFSGINYKSLFIVFIN